MGVLLLENIKVPDHVMGGDYPSSGLAPLSHITQHAPPAPTLRPLLSFPGQCPQHVPGPCPAFSCVSILRTFSITGQLSSLWPSLSSFPFTHPWEGLGHALDDIFFSYYLIDPYQNTEHKAGIPEISREHWGKMKWNRSKWGGNSQTRAKGMNWNRM